MKKERLGNLINQKTLKYTWQLNSLWRPRLNPGPEKKDIRWTIVEIWIISVD